MANAYCIGCFNRGYIFNIKPNDYTLYHNLTNSVNDEIIYMRNSGDDGFYIGGTTLSFNKNLAILDFSYHPVGNVVRVLYRCDLFSFSSPTNIFLPWIATGVSGQVELPSNIPAYFKCYNITNPSSVLVYRDDETCYDGVVPLIFSLNNQIYSSCNCATNIRLLTQYNDSLKIGYYSHSGTKGWKIFSADLESTIIFQVCFSVTPSPYMAGIYAKGFQNIYGYKKVGESLSDAAARTLANSTAYDYNFYGGFAHFHLYQNCGTTNHEPWQDIVSVSYGGGGFGQIVFPTLTPCTGEIGVITEIPFLSYVTHIDSFEQNVMADVTSDSEVYDNFISIYNEDTSIDYLVGTIVTHKDIPKYLKNVKTNFATIETMQVPEYNASDVYYCHSLGEAFEGAENTLGVSTGEFELCNLQFRLVKAKLYDLTGKLMLDCSGTYNWKRYATSGNNNGVVSITMQTVSSPTRTQVNGYVKLGVGCQLGVLVHIFTANFNSSMSLLEIIKLGDTNFNTTTLEKHYTLDSNFTIEIVHD